MIDYDIFLYLIHKCAKYKYTSLLMSIVNVKEKRMLFMLNLIMLMKQNKNRLK